MEILISIFSILIGVCILPIIFMIIDIIASPKINNRNKISSYIKFIKTLKFINKSNFINSFYLKNPISIDNSFFFVEHGELNKFITTNKYDMYLMIQDIDLSKGKSETYTLHNSTICPFKKHLLNKAYSKLRKQKFKEVDKHDDIIVEFSELLKSKLRDFKLKQILVNA